VELAVISPVALADFALATYAEPPTLITPHAQVLIKQLDGVTLIGPRGTADLDAVLRDIEAAVERDDAILGRTPNSFAADAEEIAWRIFSRITGPWAGGAHSKGGSELLVLAAMMRYAGRPPAQIAAFEPAPVGTLNGLIDPASTLITRHGEDPVPVAPPWRPHPAPVTALPWRGAPTLDLGAYHAMAGVRAALADFGSHA
jgi:hypothetical protein